MLKRASMVVGLSLAALVASSVPALAGDWWGTVACSQHPTPGCALGAGRGGGTLRLVPAQASATARRYLATIGATGTVSVTGDTVTVTVTRTRPTQLLGLVGIASLPVTGHASAHPRRRVTQP